MVLARYPGTKFLLGQCRLLDNRQLGPIGEILMSSGKGYRWFDLGAIFGEFGAKAFDNPCHKSNTVLMPPHVELLEGPSLDFLYSFSSSCQGAP